MSIERQEMETVVTKLKEVVGRENPTRLTLLSFATGSFETGGPSQQLGYAVLKHAQDVLASQPDITDGDLFVESYRRTLFDKETAELYGTEAFVPSNAATALQMIEYLGMRQDLDARGLSYHEGDGTPH